MNAPVCHPTHKHVSAEGAALVAEALADIAAAVVIISTARDDIDGCDWSELENPLVVARHLSARLREALILLGAAHGSPEDVSRSPAGAARSGRRDPDAIRREGIELQAAKASFLEGARRAARPQAPEDADPRPSSERPQ